MVCSDELERIIYSKKIVKVYNMNILKNYIKKGDKLWQEIYLEKWQLIR